MIGPALPGRDLARYTVIGTTGFLLVWTLAAVSGITSRQFLPAPWEVLARFVQLLTEPFAGYTLLVHLLSSLQRFAMGFLLAVAVGLPLGLLMATFGWLDRHLFNEAYLMHSSTSPHHCRRSQLLKWPSHESSSLRRRKAAHQRYKMTSTSMAGL